MVNSRAKHRLVVQAVSSTHVVLMFDDGKQLVVPRDKLPQSLVPGQVLYVTFETDMLGVVIKKVARKVARRVTQMALQKPQPQQNTRK